MSKKNENKEGAEKKAPVKKGKSGKISADDVKEATDASKNVALSHAPDAPSAPAVEILPTNAAANATPVEDAPSTPAEIEHKIEEVVEEAVQEAAVEAIEDIAEKAVEVLEHVPVIAESPAAETAPPQEAAPAVTAPVNTEEKLLERFLNGRTSINHYELAYSSGVNMNQFGTLEARVGKFRFRRSYVGEDWRITVEE